MDAKQEKIWRQNLKNFLYETLIKVYGEDHKDTVKKMLNSKDDEDYIENYGPKGEMMSVWVQAFTSNLYAYSPTENYEPLEFIGDRVIVYSFSKLMMVTFPGRPESDYNSVLNNYMKGTWQSGVAIEMGFNKYVRVKGNAKVGFKVAGDVFESFFGAIDTVGDYMKPGLGYILCYNMLAYITENYIDFNEDMFTLSFKSKVRQIFTRFYPNEENKKGEPIEEKIQLEGNKKQFIITLNQENLAFLKKYGFLTKGGFDKNPVLANKIGIHDVEGEAYKDAYKRLEKAGITSDWAKNKKREIDMQNELFIPYMDKVKKRYKKEGYYQVFFDTPGKSVSADEKVVRLIGIKDENDPVHSGVIIDLMQGPNDKEIKLELIKKYASGL